MGELRDLETIRLALTAAEPGHLVFGTLRTSSAPKSVGRLIDVFPVEEKENVRAMLSESLQAVITQTFDYCLMELVRRNVIALGARASSQQGRFLEVGYESHLVQQ